MLDTIWQPAYAVRCGWDYIVASFPVFSRSRLASSSPQIWTDPQLSAWLPFLLNGNTISQSHPGLITVYFLLLHIGCCARVSAVCTVHRGCAPRIRTLAALKGSSPLRLIYGSLSTFSTAFQTKNESRVVFSLAVCNYKGRSWTLRGLDASQIRSGLSNIIYSPLKIVVDKPAFLLRYFLICIHKDAWVLKVCFLASLSRCLPVNSG